MIFEFSDFLFYLQICFCFCIPCCRPYGSQMKHICSNCNTKILENVSVHFWSFSFSDRNKNKNTLIGCCWLFFSREPIISLRAERAESWASWEPYLCWAQSWDRAKRRTIENDWLCSLGYLLCWELQCAEKKWSGE